MKNIVILVRQRGFEPPHLLALPPQDSVSTVPPLPHRLYSLLRMGIIPIQYLKVANYPRNGLAYKAINAITNV